MFALIVVLSLVTGGLSSILCPTKVDSQVTVHLPHPTSCSKFLTCVGNHPVEQDCPAGLHWNVEQSFCDYPRASACSRGQLEPRPFNSTAVANSVCLPQTSQCPLNSNPSERVIFLKHRDCRKFYACVSTQQVELSCPPNLFWNSQSCVCDYEVDAECEQTDRPDDEVPQEADGENSEPEVVEDQQPAEEAEESVDDTEQEPAAPEDSEDQEPVEENADDVAEDHVEPEGVEDQELAEESDSSVDEQPQESDAIVRVRRAADGDSSSSGSSGSSSGSDTSGSDTSGSGSSSSGSNGSSGSGSSSSGSGSSGSTAQSGADIRAVSSIAVIAFTAAMSVL